DEIVAHEHDRPTLLRDLAHLPEALLLEHRIADGEDLVDKQDFLFEMRRHRERQPHIHPARVPLDGRVEELLDLGEGDDLVELSRAPRPPHAQDRAVQHHVTAPGELRVEPGPDLEEARHAPTQMDPPRGRLGDPAEDLQEGRLAGAIPADQPEPVTLAQLERDVAERPEVLSAGRSLTSPSSSQQSPCAVRDTVRDDVAEGDVAVLALVADDVSLADALGIDHDARHRSTPARGMGPGMESTCQGGVDDTGSTQLITSIGSDDVREGALRRTE